MKIFTPSTWEHNGCDIIHREIFEDEIYIKYFRIEENDVVVDLGANIGMFVLYALLNQPDLSKIYAVEPLLENFLALTKNVTFFGVENIHKVIMSKSAVGDPNNSHICGSGLTSTIIAASDVDESVKTFSFREFVEFFNIQKIDFLKMDIEGSELYIFNDESTSYFFKNNVKKIVAEFHAIHELGNFHKELFDVLQKLESYGFTIQVNSVDGSDIKEQIYNNHYLSDISTHAWDYYHQYIVYAYK